MIETVQHIKVAAPSLRQNSHSRGMNRMNVIQALSVAGVFGVFFFGALYLGQVFGYNTLEIGLAFLPITVITAVLAIRYSRKRKTQVDANSSSSSIGADEREFASVRESGLSACRFAVNDPAWH